MSEEQKDTQVAEATNSEQEQELEINLEDDIVVEDVESIKAELAKKEEIARAYAARAKKAEAELKELKRAEAIQPEENRSSLTEEAVEIKILKAQGLSEDLVKQLQKVAKINGTSIIEAQSDPIYVAYKNQKEAEEKAEKAKLGASKGSGSVKKGKDFNSSGLTDEEHKELWKQQRGY